MGDPVTMAVIGGSVGAMMNKKDPLKGALLGAAGGYGGSYMFGGSGLGASSALASAPTVSGATVGPAPVGAFGEPLAAAVPTTAAEMSSIVGNTGNVAAMGGQTFNPGFADSLKMGFSDIGKYAERNPVLTSMAAQTGMSLLNQQPTQPPPPGLMRGNPTQMPPPQYQVGVPQVSLI